MQRGAQQAQAGGARPGQAPVQLQGPGSVQGELQAQDQLRTAIDLQGTRQGSQGSVQGGVADELQPIGEGPARRQLDRQPTRVPEVSDGGPPLAQLGPIEAPLVQPDLKPRPGEAQPACGGLDRRPAGQVSQHQVPIVQVELEATLPGAEGKPMQRAAQHQVAPRQTAGDQGLGEPAGRTRTQGRDRQITPNLCQIGVLDARLQVQERAGRGRVRESGPVAGQIEGEVCPCGEVPIAQHQLGARDLPAAGRTARPGEPPAEALELEDRVEARAQVQPQSGRAEPEGSPVLIRPQTGVETGDTRPLSQSPQAKSPDVGRHLPGRRPLGRQPDPHRVLGDTTN